MRAPLRLLLLASACIAASAAIAGPVELPAQIGGAYSVPVRSIREERFAATVRQQYDFSCGSAALPTLLTHHYGYPVGEDRIFEEMYRLGDQARIRVEGFSLLDMKRYLEAHGFQADGFQEPLDKLAVANIPAIVLIDEGGYHHFVVVKGVQDGRVLIGDPARGTRAMTRGAFDAAWVNQILFVIGDHEDVARFNTAADWRAAPAAPIGAIAAREGFALPKLSPSDF